LEDGTVLAAKLLVRQFTGLSVQASAYSPTEFYCKGTVFFEMSE